MAYAYRKYCGHLRNPYRGIHTESEPEWRTIHVPMPEAQKERARCACAGPHDPEELDGGQIQDSG